MRLRFTPKIGYLLIILINVVLPLYAIELYLSYDSFWNLQTTRERIRSAAEKEGLKWDPRSKIEVVEDLRRSGADALPSFSPQLLVPTDGMQTSRGRVYPFTGPSNATDVFCNENGQWAIYKSDEHGFNNRPGLWKPDSLDVALIGDSFVHGACVQPGQDLAGQLRAHGYRALSFGIGGTGSMIQLAVLREHVRPLRPRHVFWVFYAVDVRDNVYENESPTLRRYLEDSSYTQHLYERQSEIDSIMRAYLMGEYEQVENTLAFTRRFNRYRNTAVLAIKAMTFPQIRGTIRCGGHCNDIREGSERQKVELFERVMRAASTEVASWGGEMIFVYFPDWYYYARQYDRYGIRIDSNFLLRQDLPRESFEGFSCRWSTSRRACSTSTRIRLGSSITACTATTTWMATPGSSASSKRPSRRRPRKRRPSPRPRERRTAYAHAR